MSRLTAKNTGDACPGQHFALFKFSAGHRLLSASENAMLLRHGECIADTAYPNENDGVFYTVYGCYKPQPDVTVVQAMADLQDAKDHWCRLPFADASHIVGLQDVASLPATFLGASMHIPVALLLLVDPASAIVTALGRLIPGHPQHVLTMHILYGNRSPASNILNRPGVFAYDAVDQGLSTPQPAVNRDSIATWANRVNLNLVAQAADRIY